MEKITLFKPSAKTSTLIPVFSTSVPAGFPSPADDHVERKLDLNELLIKAPAATFFVRVEGCSMMKVGIFDGDLLIVDRSLEAKPNQIILAILNNEFTVKRLVQNKARWFLVAENDDYKPVEINKEMDFEVWGVVTNVIHSLL